MKRILFVIASVGIFALMILLVSGSAMGGSQAANALPELEFLGEGPQAFDTTLDDFIVKRDAEQYDFVAGPTYVAAAEERVWAVRGTKEAPQEVVNGVLDLGWAYEGCTVEYVGIDDDKNGVRNGFFLGSELLELVQEGMVFQGSYGILVTGRDHRFLAEESVAIWYTPCEEGEPPTPTPTSEPPSGDDTIMYFPLVMYVGDNVPPPSTFTLVCDPDYDIVPVDEEIHFQFSATAYKDGAPLGDVALKGTLDTGSQTPSNIEQTNYNGVADFLITVLTGTISQTPVASVTFDDQGSYGNASCTVDFSTEPPPPTPTPTREPGFELVCDEHYTARFRDEDVEIKFAATAYENGSPLEDVDLEAVLDAGGTTKDEIEETNNSGVADFKIEVLVRNITQTPIVTITFREKGIYGYGSCTIDSAESNAFWAELSERSANN